MEILKISSNKPEKELLKLAADVLRNDGIVVYPTETVYGIAANALSKKAILKVYEAKGRNFKKPLSIAFSSLEQSKEYIEFNPIAEKLAKKFLPGPLTMVLLMKKNFPKELTFGSKYVGIRIPDNKIALDLIKRLGTPITATSANRANAGDSITAEEAEEQIGDKVDLILDGGRCKLKKPSTVIRVLDNEIEVIREGAIKKSMLKI